VNRGGYFGGREIHNQPHYAAMVDAHDEAIGRVWNKIKALGLDSSTIFVYTSDNGGFGPYTSNRPYRAGKGWIYEGGIRAPVIFSWPGKIGAGTETDELLIGTDFYPTLLELAGIPLKPQQHLDGVSFAGPILRNEKTYRNAVYWHYPHISNQGGRQSSAIRMGDFKLIERLETDEVELYNIAKDKGEWVDLSSQPENADIVDHLLNKLHLWRKDVSANVPSNFVQQATPELPMVAGCTNSKSENFNIFATIDDGTCGLTNVEQKNNLNLNYQFKILSQGNSFLFSLPSGLWDIKVFNISGKMVQRFTQVSGNFQVDVKDWVKGLYFAKIAGHSRRYKLLVY